jgi:cobalt-zinc-cadmium efflux system membrane fusion protein
MNKIMKKYNSITFSLIGLLILTSCKEEKIASKMNEALSGNNKTCITELQMSSSGYILGKMTKYSFSKKLVVNGKIHLPEKNKTIISSFIDGKVSGFNLIEGEHVKKGQYLFTLTGPEILDLQESYLNLKSKIDYLIYEKERQLKLSAENITAQKELAKIDETLRSAKSSFSALKSKLNLLGIKSDKLTDEEITHSVNLYAPMNGIVSEIKIIRGGYLQAGNIALELYDPEHLHLELMALEKDGGKLQVGQKVKFTTSTMPDTSFEAEIHLIDKKVDDHRLIAIHCHFDDYLNRLFYPDMYATGEILIGEHLAWSLPENALVQKDNGVIVLRLDSAENDSLCFEKVPVQVGLAQNGNSELIAPSANLMDARFLVEGAYYITE